MRVHRSRTIVTLVLCAAAGPFLAASIQRGPADQEVADLVGRLSRIDATKREPDDKRFRQLSKSFAQLRPRVIVAALNRLYTTDHRAAGSPLFVVVLAANHMAPQDKADLLCSIVADPVIPLDGETSLNCRVGLCDAGAAVIPRLRAVSGEREAYAADIIQCIETGGPPF